MNCSDCGTPYAEHPASRCLDVAVAKAMGWTSLNENRDPGEWGTHYPKWSGYSPSGEYAYRLPLFSTSPAAMLDALEWLKKHSIVSMNTRRSERDKWLVETYTECKYQPETYDDTLLECTSSEADTLPLAVARAVAGMGGSSHE